MLDFWFSKRIDLIIHHIQHHLRHNGPKVVSTHRTGTHPEQPEPTGYNGIPFIVGQGDWLWCALGVCCNFLGNEEFRDKVMIRMIAESIGVFFDSSEIIHMKWPMAMQEPVELGNRLCEIPFNDMQIHTPTLALQRMQNLYISWLTIRRFLESSILG